jgi:hypothetical protein
MKELIRKIIKFIITEKHYIKDILFLIAFTRLLFLEKDELALIAEIIAVATIMYINKTDTHDDSSGSILL